MHFDFQASHGNAHRRSPHHIPDGKATSESRTAISSRGRPGSITTRLFGHVGGKGPGSFMDLAGQAVGDPCPRETGSAAKGGTMPKRCRHPTEGGANLFRVGHVQYLEKVTNYLEGSFGLPVPYP